MKQYSVPSVRQLAAVVDGMAGEVSAVRLRQLRMVVGMWDRAVGREGMPGRATRGVRQLFTWPALDAFWDLALDGELWARPEDLGRRMPLATRRVVRDCLALLAVQVVPDKDVRLPVVVEAAPRATTTRRQEAELFRFLVWLAGQAPVGESRRAQISFGVRARLLALAGVATDARSRSGELAAMRVDDLGVGERSVRVLRRQQNGAHLEPVELVLPLSESTAVAVRRWLRVREQAVFGLSGSADALWVSLHPSNQGDPPGVPLRAQSIRSSYARGVRMLNGLMAGREGWEPLPDRLEGLRRSVMLEEEQRVLRERAAREAEENPPARVRGSASPDDRPVEHGREYSYTVRGCRCDECTEVASAARAARRARSVRARRR